MIRTISEILIEADNTDSLNTLERLDKEIIKNKYQFSLVEIEFAQYHLKNRYICICEEISLIMKGYK